MKSSASKAPKRSNSQGDSATSFVDSAHNSLEDAGSGGNKPLSMAAAQTTCVQALALCAQEWKDLGNGDDPSVAAPERLSVAVERITALLLIRIAAIAAPPGTYTDYSTTSICRATLIGHVPFNEKVTESAVQSLRSYVRFILKRYDKDLPFHSFRHAYHVVICTNKLIDMMLAPGDSKTGNNNNHANNNKNHNKNGTNRKSNPPPPTFGLRDDPVLLWALVFAAFIHDVSHSGVQNRQLQAEGCVDAVLYNDQSIQEQRSLRVAFEELLKDRYSKLYSVIFETEEDYRRCRLVVIDAVLATDIASPERTQLSKSKWKEAFGDLTDLQLSVEGNGIAYGRGGRRGSTSSDISMPRIAGAGGYRAGRRGSNLSTNSTLSDVTIDSYVRLKKKLTLQQINQQKQDQKQEQQLHQQQLQQQQQQQQQNQQHSQHHDSSNNSSAGFIDNLMHNNNNNATAKVVYGNSQNRRMSNQSVDSMYSDFGNDSVYEQQMRRANQNTRTTARRRASNQSLDSMYSDFGADSLCHMKKGGMNGKKKMEDCWDDMEDLIDGVMVDVAKGHNNNNNGSSTPTNNNNNLGPPIRMPSPQRQRSVRRNGHDHHFQQRRVSNQSMVSTAMESIAAESIGLAKKRQITRKSGTKGAGADGDDGSINSDLDSNADAEGARKGYQYDYGEYDDGYDDDSSLSLTPPSSEDEMDGVVITGVTLSNTINMVDDCRPPMDIDIQYPMELTVRNKKKLEKHPSDTNLRPPKRVPPRRTGTPPAISRTSIGNGTPSSSRAVPSMRTHTPPPRRASTGNLPMRFGPLTGQRIDENMVDESELKKGIEVQRPKRLGIRRSMDLSGEAIENYSHKNRRGSTGGMSTFTELQDDEYLDYDEPDELKAAVVIEVMLKAADVAHNFQNWNVMTLWMSRLYRELCEAHDAGRGHDPRPGWFDNQVRIIESYLMPLANRLEHIGVFGESIGPMFAKILEDNHNEWMVKGFDITISWQQDVPKPPVVTKEDASRYFI